MEQDAEEQEHYRSVLLSFREYEAYMMREIYRRRKHLQAMPIEMQRRLPQSSTIRNLHHFVVRSGLLDFRFGTSDDDHRVFSRHRTPRTTTRRSSTVSWMHNRRPDRPWSCRR